MWTSSLESVEYHKEKMETERRNIERPVDGRMTLVLGLFDLSRIRLTKIWILLYSESTKLSKTSYRQEIRIKLLSPRYIEDTALRRGSDWKSLSFSNSKLIGMWHVVNNFWILDRKNFPGIWSDSGYRWRLCNRTRRSQKCLEWILPES